MVNLYLSWKDEKTRQLDKNADLPKPLEFITEPQELTASKIKVKWVRGGARGQVPPEPNRAHKTPLTRLKDDEGARDGQVSLRQTVRD